MCIVHYVFSPCPVIWTLINSLSQWLIFSYWELLALWSTHTPPVSCTGQVTTVCWQRPPHCHWVTLGQHWVTKSAPHLSNPFKLDQEGIGQLGSYFNAISRPPTLVSAKMSFLGYRVVLRSKTEQILFLIECFDTRLCMNTSYREKHGSSLASHKRNQ